VLVAPRQRGKDDIMARGEKAFLDEIEALLRKRGIGYRRPTPHHLKVGAINVYSSRKLHVDGADESLPNAGAPELLRLLKERGVLGRSAGGEDDAELRALERRARRAEGERDEAREALDAAEKRLRDKSAECDELQARLRRRTSGAAAPPARDGAADGDKFRAAKRAFAKKFHPDRISAGGVERTVREEVFKEYWAELRQIEED
jgi:hypothetical protein